MVVPDFPAFTRLKQCRHGMLAYNGHDIYIGRSLDQYGEFSEGEIELFQQFVRPGQLVVEAGANIGAHTVWLAQAVGRRGTVVAFEPQRIVYQNLCANLALNSLTNVYCFQTAVGQSTSQIVVPPLDYAQDNNFGGLGLGSYQQGERVAVRTIDSLKLPQCHFLKVDVEGMEKEVLAGAVQTIATHSPVLYVENDRQEQSEELIQFIKNLDYNLYWHRPPLFNPNNFAGNATNVFGQIVSHNMLGLPRSAAQHVSGLPPV